MIRVVYEWKINDFSTQQIGRDEHGELWFQTWQDGTCLACDGDRVVTEEVAQAGDQVLTEDIACPTCTSGWQMYHPHHGGIEAEELLRLAEQPSAVTLWDYLERNFPAVAAAAREAPAIAQAVRQARVPEAVRALRELVGRMQALLGRDVGWGFSRAESRKLLEIAEAALGGEVGNLGAVDTEALHLGLGVLDNLIQRKADEGKYVSPAELRPIAAGLRAALAGQPEEPDAVSLQPTLVSLLVNERREGEVWDECLRRLLAELELWRQRDKRERAQVRSRREAGGVDAEIVRESIATLETFLLPGIETGIKAGWLSRASLTQVASELRTIADRLTAALRGAPQTEPPGAWSHPCDAVCTTITLWRDDCPHCKRPRYAALRGAAKETVHVGTTRVFATADGSLSFDVKPGPALADPAPESPVAGGGGLPDRPRIVCLCGSTRFIETFAVKTWELERQGNIVLGCTLLPSWYAPVPSHFGEYTGTKEQCDELHLRKIDLADELLVLDVGGYIGESTRREVAYAESAGKPVRYLSKESPDFAQLPLAPEPAATEAEGECGDEGDPRYWPAPERNGCCMPDRCLCPHPDHDSSECFDREMAEAQAVEAEGVNALDVLDRMRAGGWSVAIHNDYYQDGQQRTFWLFTHSSGRWAKGEGNCDVVALLRAEAMAVAALDRAEKAGE